MKHKKIFLGLLVMALTLAILLVYPSVSVAKGPLVEEGVVLWKLTKATVVDPGETALVPADPQTGFPGGILVTGYTMEAKARSNSGKLVPDGTFQLILSAFKPNADYIGQKEGIWYVQGTWTIVDKRANKNAEKRRHDTYTVEGRIQTELPINPAEGLGGWSSEATVPMSLAAGQWAQGSNGVLTWGTQGKGDLYLTLKLWPSLQQ